MPRWPDAVGEIYVIAVAPRLPRPRPRPSAHRGRPAAPARGRRDGRQCCTSTPTTPPPSASTIDLGFDVAHTDQCLLPSDPEGSPMTTVDEPAADALPRWSVTDVHESFDARSFHDAMDRCGADMARLEALFERARHPGRRAAAGHRGRRRAPPTRSSVAINTFREHADSPGRVHLRHHQHRQLRRDGRGTDGRVRHGRRRAAAADRPACCVDQLARRRRAGGGQRAGRRARRPAREAGRPRGAPDERGRGRPVRRTVTTGSSAWDATARRSSPRSSPPRSRCPTARRRPADGGGPRPGHRTPTRPCARPRTTPRWRLADGRCVCAAAMNA